MKTDLAVVRFLDEALSYEELRQTMKAKILVGIKGTAPIERLDKLCLNFLRYSIILNSYKVSLELRKVISSLKKPQFLMALTEDWCDDSGLTLPYLVKMVEVNSLLQLKFILRSENQNIMDHYLTEGKRSIPKIIALDENGKELFRWGPRPSEAQIFFEKCLQDGFDKAAAKEKLYSWLAKDQGKCMEKEFLEILDHVGE